VRTDGGHRRYRLSDFVEQKTGKTVAYARVSSHDQKADLDRQDAVLSGYCQSFNWEYEVIRDLGSRMNYRKKGLTKLISTILDGEVARLVITHKDRLLRFGSELIFSLSEYHEVEVVILNKKEDATFEEDLASDVLEIITVFSARLYGARSSKNKKLIQNLANSLQSD
jgi:predicted site-specific integrase-resolvase